MVESSASQSADSKGQIGIVPPNPGCERGHRTSMVFGKKHPYLVYGIRDNLVFRNLENESLSRVYTGHNDKITAVSVSPDGAKYAYGDERGIVTILVLTKDGEINVEKQLPFTSGQVNALVWSEDGTRLIAVGSGTEQQAFGITVSMGNKCGDILGIKGNLLCADMTTRPYNLFSSGEAHDIVNHVGIPFKGLGTSVAAGHSNYVNQIKISPDQTRFASVSSDKKI
jgi:WD40 repeat protein